MLNSAPPYEIMKSKCDLRIIIINASPEYKIQNKRSEISVKCKHFHHENFKSFPLL